MIIALVRWLPLLLLKEDVVILVAFERRVEINQVDRLIGYVSPQDVEVIAIIKKFVWHRGSFPVAITKYNETIIRLLQTKTRGNKQKTGKTV
jgi:hypothetical protein